MQIKTISKIISSKMEEWLETITDEKLRKKVRKNLLVSGWCITSMLLKEDINDFDVYIEEMKVLKDLVEYYTKPFELEVLDGRDYICNEIKDDDNEDSSQRAVTIRNLKYNQIKIYVGGGKRVNKEMEEKDLNYTPLFFSPNAISLSNQLQIVCRFHGDAEQIHKTFDFIHATNYFTFEEWLVTNKEALESILTKQLRYQGSLYPITSVIRMKKFIKRNWNISAGEILKIAFQISELDMKDPDILEEQLIGVDVAYFAILIDILRWNDKGITSHFLNTLIDRVFNEDETDSDLQ